MLWFLAALGTSFCFGLSSTLFKWGATKGLSTGRVQFFYYTIATCLVLSYGILRREVEMTLLSLSIGGIAGALNAYGNLQMTKAFQKGPASITSMIIAANVVLGIVATAIFFPESLSIWHWSGIALLLGSTAIVQRLPEKGNHIEHRSWLLHCIFALISIGLAGFFLKIASEYKIDFLSTLVALFAGGWVFLSITSYKELKHTFIQKQELYIGALAGLTMAAGYSLYLYSLNAGSASIVFTIISLNALVVVIASVVLFGERLKAYQVMGLIIALVGLTLTKI